MNCYRYLFVRFCTHFVSVTTSPKYRIPNGELMKKDIFSVASNYPRYVRCDQLKNKSSRRVTYGKPMLCIGSKANSIYFLNDRSVLLIISYKFSDIT
jgi:hypothetical protein